MVVFIALNAPRDEALLGAVLLGGMQDLVTLQPLGLYAFSYGLVAAVMTPLAKVVEKAHPATQFATVLAGGLVTAAVLLVQSRWRPIAPAMLDAGVVVPAVRLSIRVQGVVVLYTALLAPVVLGVLQRLQKLFDFEPTRRSLRIG